MSTETSFHTSGSDHQNVTAQGGVVAGMTLLSRISGFCRDMVLANFFGASEVADAFFVAFRIPNFFRRLFAEGAFNQAFVPVLARYRGRSLAELRLFVAVVGGNLTLALFFVVIAGVLFAPGLVMLFAPGFWGDEERFALTTDMVRIMFPYLGFISLTAFAGALLNSHNRYAIPAFTPVLLNVTLISAMLFAADLFTNPVFALAWGVFAAGLVQLLFQFPSIRRLNLTVVPRLSTSHKEARQVGRLLVPAVLAASVSQINTLIDTILASTLLTGSISWLYYSDRLMELPIGLVAVALGTVLLPNLSRLDAAGERDKFSASLDWGLRLGLLLGLPAAVGLYVLAVPLISTIYLRGALTEMDARMAAVSLQAFSFGVVALVMVKVLAPAYFSRRDTRTPFRIGAIAVATNVVLNLALFSWFGHVGLALATAVAAWVNAWLLLHGLERRALYQPGKALGAGLTRGVLAAAGMGAVLSWWVPADVAWLQAADNTRILWLGEAVGLGAFCYLSMLLIFGERPKNLLLRV
ncbi:MAG: murein biosynthesis integral membrane protein MurJ [Gammaproteobacteria bacterium]|nr:murein biosynthesis integral membrane protein MurJ [Gammaproteobacteria bacterium]